MTLALAWAGGAAFVASLAYFAYTYAVTLAAPRSAAADHALFSLVIDCLLFLAFATHHSIFARARVKRWIGRLVPAVLERSLYVWVSSLLLIGACAAWRPLPGTIYHLTGVAAVGSLGLVTAGVVLAALGARLVAPLELAGIDQVRRRGDVPPGRTARRLVTRFPYSLVRHPIYLGWAVAVLGVPHMTVSRLLMACLSTTYLAVAIPWEERLLAKTFGATYDAYRRRVKWRMIPFVY